MFSFGATASTAQEAKDAIHARNQEAGAPMSEAVEAVLSDAIDLVPLQEGVPLVVAINGDLAAPARLTINISA